MKKSNFLFVATILVVSLVGMSACSKSSSDVSTTENQLKTDNISKTTNDSNSIKDEDKNAEVKLSQISNNPDNSSTTENQSKPNNISQSTDSSQSNDSSTDSAAKSDNSEGKSTIVISSGEKAIQYLKQQLPEGKDNDISFGVDETLATDEDGSYYAIQLVSISNRVSGKTGTLGYYKVYQNGTYKPF